MDIRPEPFTDHIIYNCIGEDVTMGGEVFKSDTLWKIDANDDIVQINSFIRGIPVRQYEVTSTLEPKSHAKIQTAHEQRATLLVNHRIGLAIIKHMPTFEGHLLVPSDGCFRTIK